MPVTGIAEDIGFTTVFKNWVRCSTSASKSLLHQKIDEKRVSHIVHFS